MRPDINQKNTAGALPAELLFEDEDPTLQKTPGTATHEGSPPKRRKNRPKKRTRQAAKSRNGAQQTNQVRSRPRDPTPLDPMPLDPTPLDPTPLNPTPLYLTPLDPTPLKRLLTRSPSLSSEPDLVDELHDQPRQTP